MDTSIRPVPRWLHVFAVHTVIVTAAVLILGGFVTTFRVGMADPVWPTEPWYLASNYKFDFGYLVEHVHRILAWSLGLLGLGLTISAWAIEPRRGLRWFGIAAIVAILLAFGTFQGMLMRSQPGQEGVPVYASLAILIVTLIAGFIAAFQALQTKTIGGTIRCVVIFGMIAAMIQGLLGGIRVRYNDLFGREMSAVHGSFAHIVFTLLIAVAVLSARPKVGPPIPDGCLRKLRWQTLCLVLFTFLQIIWGAWIRHFPGPLSNRMHLFFAFVVVGFATLAIKQSLSDPAAKRQFSLAARFLMGLITIQVLFGIEAWLGKFMTGTLPELETITPGKAFVRTAHAHIGTWVLGVSVIFYLIARRNRQPFDGPSDASSVNWQNQPTQQLSTGVGSFS
jgi:heme A synthase